MSDSSLLTKYYPSGAPIIIQVAFRYGYGPAIIELNKRVYLNKTLSLHPVIREAIQGVWLSQCDNQYCTIMHARGMIVEGLSLDDVKTLVAFHRLPKSFPDRGIWEPTLDRLSHLKREPLVAPKIYESLSEHLSPRQKEEVGGIIAFSMLHKFLLEIYSSEIRVEAEPILFDTVDCAQDLIVYMRKRKGGSCDSIYTMCCVCKSLKSKTTWIPIEQAIKVLPKDAQFSHGFCDACSENWIKHEMQKIDAKH